MTGSLTTRKSSKYYYIRLKYKDPLTSDWKSKVVSTGIEVKNNKREAKSKIPALIEEYSYLEKMPDEYDYSVDKEIGFCDYLNIWLKHRESAEIRKSTYESDICRINSIKTYFNKLNPRLAEITTPMLNKFFDHSLLSGKRNQKTGEKENPLSVRTVRDYRNTLNMVFRRAIRDGYIKSNPVHDTTIEGKRNRDYVEEMLFLTEKEVIEFFHFLYGHEKYHWLFSMAYMAIYYGLRRSEILGLKWTAIDLEQGTISIQHTVTKVKTIHIEDNTKTHAGRRILHLSEDAGKFLK